MNRSVTAAALLIALVCSTFPILAHTYLPLVDLPNHIARHHIEANADGPLSAFYSYTAAIVPNMAVDLVWIQLSHLVDPVTFSKWTMVFYAVGLVGSTIVLSRVVLGEWSAWPAASALLVFNGSFFWGFQNYLVSVPFAILGLALWIACERRHPIVRLAIFLPFASLLYLMHFFAFSILAVTAFGREMQLILTAGSAWRRQLGRSALLSLPFLLPLSWLIFEVLHGPASPAGRATEFGTITERMDVFLSPCCAESTAAMPTIDLLGMAGLLLLVISFLTARRTSGARIAFSPKMSGPIIALATVAVAAPSWLNGVALVQIRFPFVLLALMLAGTQWKELNARFALGLFSVVVFIAGVRGIYIERYVARYEAEIADLLSTLEALPVGARLLPMRGPGNELDKRLWLAQAYAVTSRDAFVPTLFQGVHAIQLKPGLEASAHPALFAPDIRRILSDDFVPGDPIEFLRDWDAKFSYMLLMDTFDLGTNKKFELVSQMGRFSLYRIVG